MQRLPPMTRASQLIPTYPALGCRPENVASKNIWALWLPTAFNSCFPFLQFSISSLCHSHAIGEWQQEHHIICSQVFFRRAALTWDFRIRRSADDRTSSCSMFRSMPVIANKWVREDFYKFWKALVAKQSVLMPRYYSTITVNFDHSLLQSYPASLHSAELFPSKCKCT